MATIKDSLRRDVSHPIFQELLEQHIFSEEQVANATTELNEGKYNTESISQCFDSFKIEFIKTSPELATQVANYTLETNLDQVDQTFRLKWVIFFAEHVETPEYTAGLAYELKRILAEQLRERFADANDSDLENECGYLDNEIDDEPFIS